jgi:hypothetical protein
VNRDRKGLSIHGLNLNSYTALVRMEGALKIQICGKVKNSSPVIENIRRLNMIKVFLTKIRKQDFNGS